MLGKEQIRVEWLKVRATVTGTESSFAQIENPEVVVPDNMQLGLCITVMAGNDMEKKYVSNLASILLCIFYSHLLEVLLCACRQSEESLKAAYMHGQTRENATVDRTIYTTRVKMTSGNEVRAQGKT